MDYGENMFYTSAYLWFAVLVLDSGKIFFPRGEMGGARGKTILFHFHFLSSCLLTRLQVTIAPYICTLQLGDRGQV